MYVKKFINKQVNWLERENDRQSDYIRYLKSEIETAENAIEINNSHINELKFTVKLVGDE